MAALTIPTLIGNYKKQEVATRLKKFYSTFNNALIMSVPENGPIEYWEFPEHQNNSEEMDIFVNKYLYPYLQCIKKCDSTNKPFYVFSDGGCFSMIKGGGSTSDGMIHIMYDINCDKGPNEYNRDKFQFVLQYQNGKSFKFMPGSASTYYVTNRDRDTLLQLCKNEDNSYNSQGACAALIQFDGWEIADDYPFRL